MESFEIASTLEEAIISRAKVTGSPVNGSIELLPLCNMNCDMCYVRLSPEEVQKIRIHAKCTACRFRPLCCTCPACALLETGSYGGLPEYMCRYAEASKLCLDKVGDV